MKHQEAERH